MNTDYLLECLRDLYSDPFFSLLYKTTRSNCQYKWLEICWLQMTQNQPTTKTLNLQVDGLVQ